MKLLLTSSGIDNRSIAAALQELTGKTPGETKVGFVPIAINAEPGNKDWVINQFMKLWRFGYSFIDIIDPSAAGVDWQVRLEACDVIFISGGNTFHLLDQARKTGFDKWINAHRAKVFVGSSAGTILFTPNIGIAAADYGDENYAGITDLTALGWVDFEVAPHYEQQLQDVLGKYASKIKTDLYAIDDQTAIKVDGEKVEVTGEGFWKLFE